jgi:hypothetical protein
MKKTKYLFGFAILAGLLASGSALADRFHGHYGWSLNFGMPFGYPYYSYPYSPPVVVVPAPPTTYIEQDTSTQDAPQASAPQAANYWYFCAKPEGYYPYVKTCAGGWTKVSPIPPKP